jgi:hypothetical protein
MTIRVLDPSSEADVAIGDLAPRLASLKGKTVGFISNGKEGTKGFFQHAEKILREEYGAARVVLRVKSNYSAPADPHIAEEIPQWDAVVTGLGD